MEVDNRHRYNFIMAGVYLIMVIIAGIVGYSILENYSLVDAIYMTIITTSTVGFREVQPLSDAGKVFTIVLIISSIGILAYFLSQFTQSLLQSQINFIFKGYNRRSKLKRMENHVIVCGYGRNGKQVVSELQSFGESVVVIDKDHEIVINNIGQQVRFMEGDATADEILLKADIKTAKALITSLPNDADNLYVVLTARSLNAYLNIISRASDESSEKKLRIAGVDSIVMPERVGGAHMASMVTQPEVIEFLEHLNIHDDASVVLQEIVVETIPQWLRGKPLKEVQLRKMTGVNIIGIGKATGDFIINPSPERLLMDNIKLFVLGTKQQINALKELLETKTDSES
ncbi:MAG: potassium channel protein [Bacteroidetes bacterium]|nr:MAG: potassium channel protein [Bacteroidota bacterium]